MTMNNIETAKNILDKHGYTCVAIKGDIIYTSTDRGVKPLLDWLDSNTDLADAVVSDKVVGKAAAFLYVLLQVNQVYAHIISKPAYEVLQKNSIKVSYGELVDSIRNRDNTGFCPMETAVWEIDDPKTAYDTIVDTRKRLMRI